MMNKEKESGYGLSDEEKDQLTDMTNEFVRKLTDVRGGNYSGDRLLTALQFVQLVIQDAEPMLYNDEDELDEGTCGYGVDGEIGDEPAGPDLIENSFSNDLEKEIKEKFDEYSDIRELEEGTYSIRFKFVH